MNQQWKKKVRISLAAVAVVSLSSLATAADDVANLGAFADQTVALLGQPNYGFSSDETILVQGYYDRDKPAAQKLLKLENRASDLFESLGDYSVYIAGLGGQQIPESERVAQLGEYLVALKPKFLGATEFPETEFDAMVTSVASQETFLAAIRKVQPMANAAGRRGQQLITEYETTIFEVARDIGAAIQEDYSVMLAFTEALEVRHGNTLLDVVKVADSETPSTREAKEIKAKLDRMRKIFNFLEPRWDLYKLTLEELNDLQTKTISNTGRERVALLLWVRAHQRMANGMSTSSWFDYGGLIKDELGVGGA
jgi:hypothetical protein